MMFELVYFKDGYWAIGYYFDTIARLIETYRNICFINGLRKEQPFLFVQNLLFILAPTDL